MDDQLVFGQMLSDAHERHLDELRSQVQEFFDTLSLPQKDFLGTWLGGTTTYDTCVALTAASGDHHHTRKKELLKCLA